MSVVDDRLLAGVGGRTATEEALRESEERFRQAFENAPIGMGLVAPDGRFLRVNRALCEIVGRDEATLLATDFQSITHPDDLDADLSLVQEVLAGRRRNYEMEKRYFHADGHVVWIRLSVSLVRSEDGEPLYFVSQIEDITERKRRDALLARLAAVVRSSEDAIIDRSLDDRVVSWNAGAERLYGYPEEEAVGRSLHEVIPPDRWEEAVELYRRVALGEAIEHVETERQRKDGTLVRVSLSMSPVRDESGHVVGVSSIARDVTDRAVAAAALADSEARFRTLATHAPVGIFMTDAAGGCTYVNERWRELAEISSEASLGSGWIGALHPEDHERVATAWAAATGAGREIEVEYRLQLSHGRVRWVIASASPIRDEAGTVVEWVGTVSDITERRLAEEERDLLLEGVVRAREEERERLAMELHDGPVQQLTALDLRLERLRRALPDGPSEAAEAVAGVQDTLGEQVEGLRRMMTDLRPPALDAWGLEAALRDHAQSLCREAGVACEVVTSLDVRPDPDLETAAFRVAQEAIRNAVRHGSPDRVGVWLRSGRDGLEVGVLDDGRGFDPGATRSLLRDGHFGLSVMRHRVKAAGGRIEVDSGPGRGTVVRARFPRLR